MRYYSMCHEEPWSHQPTNILCKSRRSPWANEPRPHRKWDYWRHDRSLAIWCSNTLKSLREFCPRWYTYYYIFSAKCQNTNPEISFDCLTPEADPSYLSQFEDRKSTKAYIIRYIRYSMRDLTCISIVFIDVSELRIRRRNCAVCTLSPYTQPLSGLNLI